MILIKTRIRGMELKCFSYKQRISFDDKTPLPAYVLLYFKSAYCVLLYFGIAYCAPFNKNNNLFVVSIYIKKTQIQFVACTGTLILTNESFVVFS